MGACLWLVLACSSETAPPSAGTALDPAASPGPTSDTINGRERPNAGPEPIAPSDAPAVTADPSGTEDIPADGGPMAPDTTAPQVDDGAVCFAGNAGPSFRMGEWISHDPNLSPDDPASLLELYLPPGVETLRGLVFMHAKSHTHTRGMAEVAQVWNFAMLRGYIWEIDGQRLSHDEQAQILFDALSGWAQRTDHPELEHVPLLAIGESRTASLPAELELYAPGRMIGQSQVVGGIRAAEAEAALLQVPAMVIPSEMDDMSGKLQDHFFAARSRGGLWAGTVQWEKKHGFYEAWDIDWPFFNELVRLRVPKDQTAVEGPVTLAPLQEQAGWLGDATAWTAFNDIAPYAEFEGDKSQAAWLPSRAAAFAWRAFSVPEQLHTLKITAPTTNYWTWSKAPLAFGRQEPLNYNRNTNIEFVAENSGEVALDKVAFFAGDRLLGEANGSAPYSISASLPPGVHAIIAIGTRADGSQLSSRPATVAIMPDDHCP